MRTVQMTLDERLVDRVDRAARRLGKTRSAFTRDALRDALARLTTLEKERQHRQGYESRPVEPGEFDDWAREQAWPD
jgi:metal-responsive CopG/Arc/MetJ family transcriptional regulator